MHSKYSHNRVYVKCTILRQKSNLDPAFSFHDSPLLITSKFSNAKEVLGPKHSTLMMQDRLVSNQKLDHQKHITTYG